MAQGGVLKAATGTLVNTTPNTFTQPSAFANNAQASTNRNVYTAPVIPAPTVAPLGGFKPNMQGQTSGSTATVIPTFENLIGNADGRYDELRRYKNDAGAILSIPFIAGEPIYPIPEGYTYIDPEEVVEEAPTIQSATPTTARVEEVSDDSSDQKEKEDNLKNWGTENPQFINVGGTADEKGRVTNSKQYAISKNVTGGFTVPGAMSVVRGLGEGVRSLVAGGLYDPKGSYSITAKGSKTPEIFTGIELNKMFSIPDPNDPTGKKRIISKNSLAKRKMVEQ